ncbi:MAG: hypothetical protein WCD79_05480 [Chthoniobacteraceae bacterium]
MKTLLATFSLAVALIAFSGCASDEPRHTSVTTTEETEVHHPVQSTTVETQQVRPGY